MAEPSYQQIFGASSQYEQTTGTLTLKRSDFGAVGLDSTAPTAEAFAVAILKFWAQNRSESVRSNENASMSCTYAGVDLPTFAGISFYRYGWTVLAYQPTLVNDPDPDSF